MVGWNHRKVCFLVDGVDGGQAALEGEAVVKLARQAIVRDGDSVASNRRNCRQKDEKRKGGEFSSPSPSTTFVTFCR